MDNIDFLAIDESVPYHFPLVHLFTSSLRKESTFLWTFKAHIGIYHNKFSLLYFNTSLGYPKVHSARKHKLEWLLNCWNAGRHTYITYFCLQFFCMCSMHLLFYFYFSPQPLSLSHFLSLSLSQAPCPFYLTPYSFVAFVCVWMATQIQNVCTLYLV